MMILQPQLLCKRWNSHPLFLSGDSSALMDLRSPCDYTAQSSLLSIGSVPVSSSFPLFHSSQVFHEFSCCLTVVLPQIVFNLATLFSYPVIFCLFMHLLMLLFTSLCFSDPSGSNLFFLSSLLLSHRSRICAVTQNDFFAHDVCQ